MRALKKVASNISSCFGKRFHAAGTEKTRINRSWHGNDGTTDKANSPSQH